MQVPLSLTFVKIVLTLTWLIYGLLAWVLITRIKVLWQIRPRKSFGASELPDTKPLRLAVRKLGKLRRYRYRVRFRSFWTKIVPFVAIAALLNWAAQVALWHMPSSIARSFLGVVVVTFFASLLFWLKIAQPIVYGCIEGSFAMGSCAYSLIYISDTFTTSALIALLSSIYLMIRAFDNVKKGLDQRREKARSILATIEKLSDHEAVRNYRLMFAAVVRATGKLFFVSGGLREDGETFTAMPTLEKTSRYSGILFTDVDAEDLWNKRKPTAEYATFRGEQLKAVPDSFQVLFKPRQPIRTVPTSPAPGHADSV
jgi:hypothetical protein